MHIKTHVCKLNLIADDLFVLRLRNKNSSRLLFLFYLDARNGRDRTESHFFFFFFFFFFFAALTDLTLASKRPMNSMGPTGAQKSAPGPIFQDRHSGNIVINVRMLVEVGAPFRRLTAMIDPVCNVCSRLPHDFLLGIVTLVLGVSARFVCFDR